MNWLKRAWDWWNGVPKQPARTRDWSWYTDHLGPEFTLYDALELIGKAMGEMQGKREKK